MRKKSTPIPLALCTKQTGQHSAHFLKKNSTPVPLNLFNSKVAEKLVEDAIANKEVSESRKLLEQALRADPLSGLAWVNYAICKSKMGETALEEWLATAILQPGDLEAWAKAIAFALHWTTDDPIIKVAIFREAIRLHGASVRSEVSVLTNVSGGAPQLLEEIWTAAVNAGGAFAEELPVQIRQYQFDK